LVGPWLGHATWHAYRALVPAKVDPATPPRIARDVVV